MLPVLNNLLENREMGLDDGRFLMEPSRYDQLRPGSLPPSVVRVSEAFRVIALTVPVPPWPGNPLDPPLRSRFQARVINQLPVSALRTVMHRAVPAHAPPREHVAQLLAVVEATSALNAHEELDGQLVPSPGAVAMLSAARTCTIFPRLSPSQCLARVFPWESVVFHPETAELIAAVIGKICAAGEADFQYSATQLTPTHANPRLLHVVSPSLVACCTW